jgi:hypothetical protein
LYFPLFFLRNKEKRDTNSIPNQANEFLMKADSVPFAGAASRKSADLRAYRPPAHHWTDIPHPFCPESLARGASTGDLPCP